MQMLLLFLPDGKIIVGGHTYDGYARQLPFVLFRYKLNGTN
jgi:hypothetical protein